MLPVLPAELKELILDYHGSIEEYPKRVRMHEELFHFFRNKLLERLNEEFSFIFYPNFYQDLAITIVHVVPPGF